MIELLRTKLFIPRSRANLVPRPRLVERLNAGLDRKLTLMAAPAGFGKTTLLAEWIAQSPRCVTWLSLDDGDNDSTQFWAYFIASLQQFQPGLGEGALALLQSHQQSPVTSILTALINEITDIPGTFAIVLDDYHFINYQPIHEALAFLLAHLPANLHLVITTRADPPLPLARLRARDQLTEIRANDLRFTPDEAAEFLTQVMGLSLTAEEVAALETRTEGWIAGLQIAALSMQGRQDLPGFIQAFSGSHRHILGYLAEEVLDRRPKGTLNFLLQTSVLDRLCGPLCDAVTGDSGGQAMLENLEHANLFIIPLDDEGVWYRYHPLFAEVLQARLRLIQDDRVSELYRRAENWHAQQGMMDEAVRYALAGADFENAAHLIESVAGDMLRRGAIASLAVWLDAMPEEKIRARSSLCLVRGWTYFMGPALSLESADEWARLALRVAQADGSLDPGLTGEVTALQAMIAATRSEVARSIELARQALDDLPLDSPWRCVIVFCLGTAHYLSGDMAAAAPVFEAALKLSQAGGARFIQMAAASFLAEILVFRGHLGHAVEMYRQVLEWVDPAIPQKGGVMAHGGLANILCEQNHLDAALDHIQLGIGQVDQVGGAWSAHVLYRALARVYQAQGNWQDALVALDRTHEVGQNAQVSLVVAQAAALRASLLLAQGDLEAAATWAANCGLSPDDAQAAHPGWREVEYLALARVLEAQGRQAEALSLLDRLLQAAQAGERNGSAISILAFQALVLQKQRDTNAALHCLERALTLAAPEGYIRIFVDEGEPLRLLLVDFRAQVEKRRNVTPGDHCAALLAYTNHLLSAFPQPQGSGNIQPETLVEPVSERELEVLHLINNGLTNQEIADQLVIAISTVKTHINHLYGKFGVRSRTQAVANARDLGLLTN